MIFVSILWALFYIFLCSFLILVYRCGIYEPSQTYLQQIIFVMVHNVHDDMSEQISITFFLSFGKKIPSKALCIMHDGSFDKVLDPPCFWTSNDDDGNDVFVFLWN